MKQINLDKIVFGVKTLEKGITGAVEYIKDRNMNLKKDTIKQFKKDFGKNYEMHIKREQIVNLLELAAWTLELRTFEEKKEETMTNVKNLMKDAEELLEAINE